MRQASSFMIHGGNRKQTSFSWRRLAGPVLPRAVSISGDATLTAEAANAGLLVPGLIAPNHLQVSNHL
jgi:hypothetical protein